MASVRNIASATGILALSVLAACSRGGSSLTAADSGQSFKTSEVTAQVSGQERQYSFKDGDKVVAVSVPSQDGRGSGKAEIDGVEYSVTDVCSNEGDCSEVGAIITRKQGQDIQTQRVLLQKNDQGALAGVCTIDKGDQTVEEAYGNLLSAKGEPAGCQKPVVKQVEDTAKKVGEKIEEKAQEVKEDVKEAIK